MTDVASLTTMPPSLTAEQLVTLTQQPNTPFSLKTDNGVIACVEVLRFLPGKRLVVRAEQDNQQVIVKCFYGNGAHRYYQRELKGINGFIHAGIDTPALLCNSSEQQALQTIVTEYLGKVKSLGASLATDDTRR